jgi:hypothetical protein
MDHIVIDGWAARIFQRELHVLYLSFASGRPSPLPELPNQVADYAVWQRRRYTEPVLAAEQAYWRSLLKDAPRDVALPFDHARDGKNTTGRLSVNARRPAQSVVTAEGGVFANLWTAFAALLHATTAQEDLVVGTFYANRSHPALLNLIGSFANLVVVRTRVDGKETLGELRGRLRNELLETFDHAELPFPRVVEAVQPPRRPGRQPLFNITFQLVVEEQQPNAPAPGGAPPSGPAPRMSIAQIPLRLDVHRVDLSVVAWHVGDTMRFDFEFNAHLFEKSTIEAFAQRYADILDELVTKPERPLTELRLAGAKPSRAPVKASVPSKSEESSSDVD